MPPNRHCEPWFSAPLPKTALKFLTILFERFSSFFRKNSPCSIGQAFPFRPPPATLPALFIYPCTRGPHAGKQLKPPQVSTATPSSAALVFVRISIVRDKVMVPV